MKFDKEFVKKLTLIGALAVCLNSFILIDRLGVDRWYMVIPATLLSILLVTCYFNLSSNIGSEAIQKIQKDIEKNSEVINDIYTDIRGVEYDVSKLNRSMNVIRTQFQKLLEHTRPPDYLSAMATLEPEGYIRYDESR